MNISGTKKIIVRCYYRHPSVDGTSLEILNISQPKIRTSTILTLLGGDINLGHIDWSIPSIVAGKPEQKLLDIAFDRNLQHMVDKERRKDRILDMFFTNKHSSVNKMTTLTPIGEADQDIVYFEIDTWLKRVRELPRKIMKFNKANQGNMKADLIEILTTLQEKYKHSSVDEQCENFKIDLIKSIEKNDHIQTQITYKLRKLTKQSLPKKEERSRQMTKITKGITLY